MKDFVKNAEHAESYGCEIRYISHADPILIIQGSFGRELERMSLIPYRSLEDLHALFKSKGFSRDAAIEAREALKTTATISLEAGSDDVDLYYVDEKTQNRNHVATLSAKNRRQSFKTSVGHRFVAQDGFGDDVQIVTIEAGHPHDYVVRAGSAEL